MFELIIYLRELNNQLAGLYPAQRLEVFNTVIGDYCIDCGAEKVERQVFCGSIMECVNCDT